jgi:regulator of RNase E activity RraA
VRGAAALLTDGCVRDTRNYPDGLAVFAAGVHTMTFRHALIAAQINVPVACAGALIVPGDLLVGDEDGVAVVPRALIGQVIEASRGQEALDGFLKHKISAGASLHEVAPPSAALLQEYQRTRGQP